MSRERNGKLNQLSLAVLTKIPKTLRLERVLIHNTILAFREGEIVLCRAVVKEQQNGYDESKIKPLPKDITAHVISLEMKLQE